MKRLLMMVAAIIAAGTGVAQAQSMQAATSPAGPGLKVVLTWPTTATVTRLNVFRRTTGAPVRINAQPIARLTSCNAIKSVISVGSPDWTLLSDGLAVGTTQFDPCQISTLAANSEPEQRLQLIARARWPIALVAGQAYVDQAVTAGTTYVYELHGLDALNNDTGVIFPAVTVTAGTPVPIPPPGALKATAGDSRVLLQWADEGRAAGFVVTRSLSAAGPYVQVNASTMPTRITRDLDGKPLATPSNGFLDIQRWNLNGNPTTHSVNGADIAGPADGVTYTYKVASIDILGQQGAASGVVSATPVDTTPPVTPSGVAVNPVEPQSQIEVRWTAITLDRDGHIDSSGVAGYQVFRYDSENALPAGGTQIGVTVAQPPSGTTFATIADASSGLRQPYGSKTWWYRVRAVDVAGNISGYSAAIGGHLKDTTPPAPPKNLRAEGFDDYIETRWDANTEPDLDHYQIYRSYCHNGSCNPCDPRLPAAQKTAVTADDRRADDRRPDEPRKDTTPASDKQPVCGGEYILIGSVSLAEAKLQGTPVSFKDRTIPAGSPLCYSYWIKAYDHDQNMSGSWPVPAPNEQTVCQRLRDKTPPDAAIITGVFARSGSVRVEWIGPPVQDIRAYHVYRSEQEGGSYTWVGGVTVEVPPTPPKVLNSPYKPPAVVNCDTIPLALIDSMSAGYAIDSRVEAKKFYWYKVVGIDQSGNEAPLDKAVPVGTFTYTSELPPAPTIVSINGSTAPPFELLVSWNPGFDPGTTTGFAVFRSDQMAGLYRQVGNLQKDTQFHDPLVVKGATYWYKVVKIDLTGQVSQTSAAVSGTLPP